MRRVFLTIGLGVAIVAILYTSPSPAAEQMVIVGTGSGVPLLEAVGKAFTQQYPGIVIALPESIGSGGGIKAVGNDEYLLGRVAREIKDQEKRYGLEITALAKTPIVFYVNDSVPLKNLTQEQACGVYSDL